MKKLATLLSLIVAHVLLCSSVLFGVAHGLELPVMELAKYLHFGLLLFISEVLLVIAFSVITAHKDYNNLDADCKKLFGKDREFHEL